jgi:hypothetical protein
VIGLASRLIRSLSAPRDELVHQLGDGDLRAELVVDGGHLQAHDPAAEDEQPLRHLTDFQGAGGVHDPRVRCRDERQRQRFGASGDDGLLEVDDGGSALGELNWQLMR